MNPKNMSNMRATYYNGKKQKRKLQITTQHLRKRPQYNTHNAGCCKGMPSLYRPFFFGAREGEGDYSAMLFCIEIACNSMRKPRGVFGKDMWPSFVGLYLNLDK